ncbi:hypothetical protein A2U01_0061872 [Trifolium medium]|uniref:Uncharacterized protein n=1 Tax=Trifolium medium TaxID=97028 RepID=A0A392RW89_9FABA|nr:hypothetical protein [Trifolium medium]
MLIRVSLPVISSERGRSLEPRRNGCPHNFFRKRVAIIFLVTAMWRAAKRIVVIRRCRAFIPVVSPTSAGGRALFVHEH